MRIGLFRCGAPGWSGEGGTMEQEKRTEKLLICISESERSRIEKKMEDLGIKNMSA